MKKITAITLLPVLIMFFAFIAKPVQTPEQLVAYNLEIAPLENTSKTTDFVEPLAAVGNVEAATPAPVAKPATPPAGSTTEQMLGYALTLIGTPYIYGGSTTKGFDCSGFTTHIYDQIGVTVGRSSGLQALDGIAIERHEVRQGDLLIFTGTQVSLREPGHVGIVISPPGDTIEFIHSSSVGGVKISKVEGTRYNDRLLQIRRVL